MDKKIRELLILGKENTMLQQYAKLSDACRERGSQYANLESSYIDDNDFCHIDGWRVDAELIDDAEFEVSGSTIAYVDMRSGRVVYVDPDARWDAACQEMIKEVSEKAKSESVKRSTMFPVTVHYSFDSEVPVYLFSSYEEATSFIKKDYEEERRIQIEENGHVEDCDFRSNISEDLSYAQMFINPKTGEEPDVIEWTIGTIKN